MNNLKIAKNIKLNRKKNNLTQEDLAKKLDTVRQTIQKYENGTVTNIPLEKLKKMSQIFNISIQEILGLENEQKLYFTDFSKNIDELEEYLKNLSYIFFENKEIKNIKKVEFIEFCQKTYLSFLKENE